MISRINALVIAVALFVCSPLIRIGHAQQAQTETQAVQVIGLAGLKENTKGRLTIVNGTLRFIYAKSNADVAATSIEDVVTGKDSQRVIGGTSGTVASLAAPYGTGSVLPLFRKKLDTLTIQYRDADGGLHGAIFTMPRGKADAIKNELVAQGAHTSVPNLADLKKSSADSREEAMRTNFRNALAVFVLLTLCFAGQLRAEAKQPAKIKASAVEVKMITSDELTLPPEFQVSLYENLIEQLGKKAVFPRVYRDGDRNADNAADLITLECTLVKFKKGSETLREITTVAGATSMTLRCEFRDKGGNSLLVRDITGKVRFFGGNLKATYDFAKKTAKVADENFSSGAQRS